MNDIRQEDMAEKMKISRATLINYEKGHTAINTDVLIRLEECYPNFSKYDNSNQKPQLINDNYVDLQVLFSILQNNIKTTSLITIIFMIIGLSTSFLFIKYYDSEISLYPAKKDNLNQFSQFQSLAMNFGISNFDNEQSFNIPDLVKSKLIATSAINKKWKTQFGSSLNLLDLWSISDDYSRPIQPIDSLRIMELAIKKFHKHISVNEDQRTGLIRIKTTFRDPFVASQIANSIGLDIQNYIQKENSAQSKKEKIFISDRLLIVKKELELAELNLKNFKERNRGYEDSPELFMMYSRLNRDVELKKEVFLTLQQQLELARIEEVRQSPILHILDLAVPASQKSSPNRIFFMIIFGLIGFICSYLRAILKY